MSLPVAENGEQASVNDSVGVFVVCEAQRSLCSPGQPSAPCVAQDCLNLAALRCSGFPSAGGRGLGRHARNWYFRRRISCRCWVCGQDSKSNQKISQFIQKIKLKVPKDWSRAQARADVILKSDLKAGAPSARDRKPPHCRLSQVSENGIDSPLRRPGLKL